MTLTASIAWISKVVDKWNAHDDIPINPLVPGNASSLLVTSQHINYRGTYVSAARSTDDRLCLRPLGIIYIPSPPLPAFCSINATSTTSQTISGTQPMLRYTLAAEATAGSEGLLTSGRYTTILLSTSSYLKTSSPKPPASRHALVTSATRAATYT